MYDAPCKTLEDITFALKHGIRVNANSFKELEKIQVGVARLLESEGEGFLLSMEVGVRINPLVGGGSIEILSTATASSKFGIPLTPTTRVQLLSCFKDIPYLKGR